MPESAALSREGLLWVLMWAHTALVAEYEAFRLCEVGRRVEGRAKSGGKAMERSRAASRAAGKFEGRQGGRKFEGRAKSGGGNVGGKLRGGGN